MGLIDKINQDGKLSATHQELKMTLKLGILYRIVNKKLTKISDITFKLLLPGDDPRTPTIFALADNNDIWAYYIRYSQSKTYFEKLDP
jgi:hypothetical protein